MKDWLFFDSMITPKIITIVYWLLLAMSFITGLGMMFAGSYYHSGAMSFLTGLLTIVGGCLASRIYCELLIVLFKIHENLKKLAEKP